MWPSSLVKRTIFSGQNVPNKKIILMINRDEEIKKFQIILKIKTTTDCDMERALKDQREILIKCGVSSVEILNLIHDRHARDTIIVPPDVLAHYKRKSNKRSWNSEYPAPPPPLRPEKTKEELAREYVRRKENFSMEETEELQVPYGTDQNGALVAASDATKSNQYNCPQCCSTLILRDGQVKTKHFAHKAETNCNGETIAHNTAKNLIAQIINDQSENAKPISLDCTCMICFAPMTQTIPREKFTSAKVEFPIGDFICDAVTFQNEKTVLAIEICQTNAVTQMKGEKLAIPWIELDASTVLANPFHWKPIQSRLNPVACKKCRSSIAKIKAIAERDGIELEEFVANRDPSRSQYLAAVDKCFKCHSEILLFWWNGVPFCEESPPTPIPRTVQHRFSKAYGGKYWINTCPRCSAIQGDNFVFLAKNSPLFGFPLRTLPQEKTIRENNNRATVNEFMKIMNRNFRV